MKHFLYSLVLLLLVSCGNNNSINTKKMNLAMLATDLEILAADDMEGRAPCTAGGERAVRYLQSRMEEIGLEPAFGGSYLQEVPLVKILPDPSEPVIVKDKKGVLRYTNGTEISLWSPMLSPEISLTNNEIVFVGFGIDAPEHNWNDFEKIDVKGKTVMVLVNDPGFFTKDSTLFNGTTMTYTDAGPINLKKRSARVQQDVL